MKDNLNNMFYGAPSMIHIQAKTLRKNETRTEKILWTHLSNKKLGVKFRRQHPVSQFIVDFYCHELKLVIEIDGKIHLRKENIEYDKMRTQLLNYHNLQVLRFSNEEVLKDIQEVINRIKLKVKQCKKFPNQY